jgi:hypothetical protein
VESDPLQRAARLLTDLITRDRLSDTLTLPDDVTHDNRITKTGVSGIRRWRLPEEV